MWKLGRASIHLRNRGLCFATTRISCVKSEIARSDFENCNAGIIEAQGKLDDFVYSPRFYNSSSSSKKSYTGVHTFSSQAGAKSSGEQDDNVEDPFSELENPHDSVQEAASHDEIDDDSDSESELSECENVAYEIQELKKLGTETDVAEKKSRKTASISATTKVILNSPTLSVSRVMDKWVEEGNKVTQPEISATMLQLRKRRLFVKALQLSEWLESGKYFEFTETNHASRVDLIAKVRGIYMAEEYINKLPESFRGEVAYRTLLANCVAKTNVKKSEEVFNKMKKLFPLTSFSCNQLLLLYKKTNRNKISDVLLLMEKENIKPTPFTYQILIDVKGQGNEINAMEKIVDTMKSEGTEPNVQIQASLARHYAASGQKDKAESILKEMEGEDITKTRWIFPLILPIYASLGREDEVGRLWKVCESDPHLDECFAVIRSWGELNKIEEAESAFEKMEEKLKKPSSRHFTALLNVYADHKMLAKGKDLVRRMAENGMIVGPLTWDALVKLYISAGEVEKADSILEKAVKQKRGIPLFISFYAILVQYARRGDVHGTEKIFLKMKQAGYTSRIQPYKMLLHAYINAKTPAYGIRDRMKVDNIIPNKALNDLLGRADGFAVRMKSEVSELLE